MRFCISLANPTERGPLCPVVRSIPGHDEAPPSTSDVGLWNPNLLFRRYAKGNGKSTDWRGSSRVDLLSAGKTVDLAAIGSHRIKPAEIRVHPQRNTQCYPEPAPSGRVRVEDRGRAVAILAPAHYLTTLHCQLQGEKQSRVTSRHTAMGAENSKETYIMCTCRFSSAAAPAPISLMYRTELLEAVSSPPSGLQ